MIDTTPPDVATIIKAEQRFLGKFTLVAAIILIMVGFLGMMSAMIMLAATDGILAAILIIGGLTWVVHRYQLHAHGLADWLSCCWQLARCWWHFQPQGSPVSDCCLPSISPSMLTVISLDPRRWGDWVVTGLFSAASLML